MASGRWLHGAPWSQEQMLTLAGYILLAATFYAVAGAAMEDSRQRVASIVLNVVCTCVVFACWIYTELTDPSLEGGISYPCMKQTQDNVRYCAACRKRVPGMDHHCVWLNTCIGKRNYVPFFVMTAVGSLQFSFLTFADAMVLFSWPASLGTGGSVFVVLHGIGSVVVAIAFLSLLGFHIYLIVLGVGTYDWIFLSSGGAAGAGVGKGTSLATPPSPSEAARREADARARWEAKYGKAEDEEKGEAGAAASQPRDEEQSDQRLVIADEEGGEASPAPMDPAPYPVPGVGALSVREGAVHLGHPAAGGAEHVLRLWPARAGDGVTRVCAASSRGGRLAVVVEARTAGAEAVEGWAATVDLPNGAEAAAAPLTADVAPCRMCPGPVGAATIVWTAGGTCPCALAVPARGERLHPASAATTDAEGAAASAEGEGESVLGCSVVARGLDGGAWREVEGGLEGEEAREGQPPLLCADLAGDTAALVVPAGAGETQDGEVTVGAYVATCTAGDSAALCWLSHPHLPLSAPEAVCVVHAGGDGGSVWVVGAAGVDAGEEGDGAIAVVCTSSGEGSVEGAGSVPAHVAAPRVMGVAASAPTADGTPRVSVRWRAAGAGGEEEERWAVADIAPVCGVSVCRVVAEGGVESAVAASPSAADEKEPDSRLLWGMPDGRVLAVPAVEGSVDEEEEE